ncbi:MAG: tetratricopeptide repeat protein, partial [Thermomicrobiales bacterium]
TLRSLQSQLESRLTLLGDVAPRAHQRHRSLRDTIAWSYGLLDDPSQHLFRQMAVFQGGCSLEALKYVSRDDSDRLLKALRALVSNSLVRLVSSSAGESRYTMLETVREYGLECLTESGAAETSFRRHAEWFLMAAEQAERHQNTLDRDVWLDSLEEDLGNVHAALAWTIEHNEAAMAMAFCGALLPLWQHRFHSETGRTWVERAMALSAPAPVESVRKASFCAGTLAYMHHDVEQASEHFERALNGYRGAGDPAMTGRVELALGRLAWDAGKQNEARSHFEHAMEHFEQAGDSSGIALSLHYLGLVAWKDGRFPEATEHLQHALRRWRGLGFQWELTQCIPGHLADVARAAGDLTGAMTLYQECLAINRERLDTENMSWSLAGLAMIKLSDRELDEAGRLMALAQRFEALTVAPLTPTFAKIMS